MKSAQYFLGYIRIPDGRCQSEALTCSQCWRSWFVPTLYTALKTTTTTIIIKEREKWPYCSCCVTVLRSATLLKLSLAVVSMPAMQAKAATHEIWIHTLLYRLKVLVHITFLNRYNLFIHGNVLLQWVADPVGILHCMTHCLVLCAML